MASNRDLKPINRKFDDETKKYNTLKGNFTKIYDSEIGNFLILTQSNGKKS
jgi:hypothetical protein